MYPKLSSDEYNSTLRDVQGGIQIDLTQVSSGKVKTFFLAGEHSALGLIDHMNSLTDDLCSQWFNERVKKGKTAKAATA